MAGERSFTWRRSYTGKRVHVFNGNPVGEGMCGVYVDEQPDLPAPALPDACKTCRKAMLSWLRIAEAEKES